MRECFHKCFVSSIHQRPAPRNRARLICAFDVAPSDDGVSVFEPYHVSAVNFFLEYLLNTRVGRSTGKWMRVRLVDCEAQHTDAVDPPRKSDVRSSALHIHCTLLSYGTFGAWRGLTRDAQNRMETYQLRICRTPLVSWIVILHLTASRP